MEYVKYDSDQRLELRKNLERLRLRYNLSKQELADDLGYSKKQSTLGSVGIAYPTK